MHLAAAPPTALPPTVPMRRCPLCRLLQQRTFSPTSPLLPRLELHKVWRKWHNMPNRTHAAPANGQRSVKLRSRGPGTGHAPAHAAFRQRALSEGAALLAPPAPQVVGHNRGRSSPWSSMLPDAHDVLPAFMEEVGRAGAGMKGGAGDSLGLHQIPAGATARMLAQTDDASSWGKAVADCYRLPCATLRSTRPLPPCRSSTSTCTPRSSLIGWTVRTSVAPVACPVAAGCAAVACCLPFGLVPVHAAGGLDAPACQHPHGLRACSYAGVYMMLSKERVGVDTFLSAALPHDAPRLPLHSEPDAAYYLMGWCLVNRRLDPRITAIEFIEVR